MFTAAVGGPEGSTQFFDTTDTITVYSGGSRSWRRQNPGLIGYGLHAYEFGAIGNIGGVAVFADAAAGKRALVARLACEDFQWLTVEQAMRRFYPPYELPPPPPPPEGADPLNPPPPPPPTCPYTGLLAENTMNTVSTLDRQRMAEAIQELIGWEEGLITRETKEQGSLQSRARLTTGNNVIINGRSAVHAGSGGTLTTFDVCNTPRGKGCPPVLYTNVARSADAAKTASTVKINGHPACHEDSIFAKSTGDEAGRCGGIRSGTTRGKAEFLTSSPNVFIEGKPAVRQFDLMVSNNQNTPPAPLMQSGGAPPEALEVGEIEELEETYAAYKITVRAEDGTA